jgi:RNA polymerase sigma-70 factor (ECF subfamily)
MLVARAQNGDAAAIGELYQRHVDRVYSYISFKVQDRTVAEDLTQEVFLHAIRALNSFKFRGSVTPWLMSIARNVVVDHWRRRSRRPEDALSTLEGETEEEGGLLDRLGAGEVVLPDDRAELVLTRDRIVKAAVHLTELQRQVVALRFAAGLSVKETADAMARSEGAVKNLQHHALKALKKVLAE